MSNTKFCWFCPSIGDRNFIGADDITIPASTTFTTNVAKHAERMGFDTILVPVGPNCLDPMIVASLILQNTNKINALIAYYPNMAPPPIVKSYLSTLNDFSPGRVHLNIVQGTATKAEKLGIRFYENSDRDSYLKEYSSSLRNLLHNADEYSEDFQGEYIKFSKNQNVLKNNNIPPKMYIGGGKTAMEIAAQYYDTYLTFGDSVEYIKKHTESAKELARIRHSREIQVGMAINIVARKTHLEALEACEKMISKTPKTKILEVKNFYNNKEILKDRTYSDFSKSNFYIDENIWGGLMKVRPGGPVATLFGSYSEVSEMIHQYIDSGVDFFNFAGYPTFDELDRVGNEVISRL